MIPALTSPKIETFTNVRFTSVQTPSRVQANACQFGKTRGDILEREEVEIRDAAEQALSPLFAAVRDGRVKMEPGVVREYHEAQEGQPNRDRRVKSETAKFCFTAPDLHPYRRMLSRLPGLRLLEPPRIPKTHYSLTIEYGRESKMYTLRHMSPSEETPQVCLTLTAADPGSTIESKLTCSFTAAQGSSATRSSFECQATPAHTVYKRSLELLQDLANMLPRADRLDLNNPALAA